MQTEITDVSAESFIALLEELIDLKIQRHVEAHFKVPTEITRLLLDKRETDRRRLDQIRGSLVRMLSQQESGLQRQP